MCLERTGLNRCSELFWTHDPNRNGSCTSALTSRGIVDGMQTFQVEEKSRALQPKYVCLHALHLTPPPPPIPTSFHLRVSQDVNPIINSPTHTTPTPTPSQVSARIRTNKTNADLIQSANTKHRFQSLHLTDKKQTNHYRLSSGRFKSHKNSVLCYHMINA